MLKYNLQKNISSGVDANLKQSTTKVHRSDVKRHFKKKNSLSDNIYLLKQMAF